MAHHSTLYRDGNGPLHAVCVTGIEHGVVEMAEALRVALEQRGADGKIINMTAGGDIDTEVFQWIEHCDTFVVFGSRKYGEDTGNQVRTRVFFRS